MGTLGERGDQDAARAALTGFRDAFYGCLSGWSDALFELTDAALCGPASVGSVPSLSLEPVFRRSHGSLYKALAAGRIDAEALRGALVAHRPAGWPAVFAVDDVCWRAYLRRFDLEHTFRFAKGTLGWTTPALRTPEQPERWTWLVVAAYTQLRLARGLVADDRLPWERPCDPARLTPSRVRRGFRRLRAAIGTPACPPKAHAAGPGRPKGTRRPARTRYPAVKRAA